MAEQAKEKYIEHTHINKIWNLFLILHVLIVLVNTINHKDKHSFKDILRQKLKYVFCKPVIAKVFAQAF
jgi:hypothetical protein